MEPISPGQLALIVVLGILVIFVIVALARAIRIVPQATAILIERFGRYKKTLQAGLNFLVYFVDKVRSGVDLREQVVSFPLLTVITSDNLVVIIATVMSF